MVLSCHTQVCLIFKCQLSLVEHIPRVIRNFLRDLHTTQFPEWVIHSLVGTLLCPTPASASVLSDVLSDFLLAT